MNADGGEVALLMAVLVHSVIHRVADIVSARKPKRQEVDDKWRSLVPSGGRFARRGLMV